MLFDKRAVDKGQVWFSDIAYVEANSRYGSRSARVSPEDLTVRIELTDFSVYYSQGITDDLAHSLKQGKSEVVCDAGVLIKQSKDKKGIVTRETLTKRWTAWVDYWAVDFHYESRREIIQVDRASHRLPHLRPVRPLYRRTEAHQHLQQRYDDSDADRLVQVTML